MQVSSIHNIALEQVLKRMGIGEPAEELRISPFKACRLCICGNVSTDSNGSTDTVDFR